MKNFLIIALIIAAAANITASTLPPHLINLPTEADRQLEQLVRPLFFELPITQHAIQAVHDRCIATQQANDVTFTTRDNYRIAGLYFKRPEAKFNLLCINGYMFEQTPPMEWCAPFAQIFAQANILLFDWRGFCKSEGYHGLLYKNSFGMDAWQDIQAATDFIRSDNNLPLVSMGLCMGAGQLVNATLQAEAQGLAHADILVLNGIFSRFSDIFARFHLALRSPFAKLLFHSGVGRYVFSELMSGSLFQLNPIDLIKDIKTPCLFQHYTQDTFVPQAEMMAVFEQATCTKQVMLSQQGRHVRIHKYVPAQLRDGVCSFLWATLAASPSSQPHVVA